MHTLPAALCFTTSRTRTSGCFSDNHCDPSRRSITPSASFGVYSNGYRHDEREIHDEAIACTTFGTRHDFDRTRYDSGGSSGSRKARGLAPLKWKIDWSGSPTKTTPSRSCAHLRTSESSSGLKSCTSS